jgi:serpin B
VPRSPTDPGEAAVAAVALNDFGTRLFRRLAEDRPFENIVVSPTSLASALTMASAGAVGPTRDEMLATLSVSNGTSIHRSMNALIAELDTRTTNAGTTDAVTVAIGSSLWTQTGLTIQPPFLDLLAAEYGAGVHVVDYVGGREAARAAINSWVDETTHHRIRELIAPDMLTAETRLALVNAMFLKAPWSVPFEIAATSDQPFILGDGTAVDVPMMAATGTMAYASGDGWQAVELPYVNGELAMLLFLPEEGFLKQFEEIFLVTDATEYLEPARVALVVPRFAIESNIEMSDALRAMGMNLAFDTAADFSGITADEQLHIATVVHQGNITVDEHGTEAAAATAAIGAATSAPTDEPIALSFDRPFVFAVRDIATQAVLFLGRMSDPRT